MLNNGGSLFGWIMQPALFNTPESIDSRDIGIARGLTKANEQHIEAANSAGIDTIWVEDHMGWGERAHLECFITKVLPRLGI